MGHGLPLTLECFNIRLLFHYLVVVTLSFSAKMDLADFECNLKDWGLPEMAPRRWPVLYGNVEGVDLKNNSQQNNSLTWLHDCPASAHVCYFLVTWFCHLWVGDQKYFPQVGRSGHRHDQNVNTLHTLIYFKIYTNLLYFVAPDLLQCSGCVDRSKLMWLRS